MKPKQTAPEKLQARIKGYKALIKSLMQEFPIVEETLALEYELRIDALARKLINAQKAFAKN